MRFSDGRRRVGCTNGAVRILQKDTPGPAACGYIPQMPNSRNGLRQPNQNLLTRPDRSRSRNFPIGAGVARLTVALFAPGCAGTTPNAGNRQKMACFRDFPLCRDRQPDRVGKHRNAARRRSDGGRPMCATPAFAFFISASGVTRSRTKVNSFTLTTLDATGRGHGEPPAGPCPPSCSVHRANRIETSSKESFQ